MKNTLIIFRRELAGYFATPVAYVFIVFFLILTGVFTFVMGGFFERGQADLRAFFAYHPWLYVALIPALSMRLWAEERKTGTIELLFTLPISMTQAVVGKFLAAWAFTGVALALTFPTWLTAAWLGDPDHGVILAGYVGSFLMAGGFLAIGACVSAITKNQVIAFVVSVVLCLFFVISGNEGVTSFVEGWVPPTILEAIASFSFQAHFLAISRGVLDVRDVIYFASLIVFWLFANVVVLDMKKAD